MLALKRSSTSDDQRNKAASIVSATLNKHLVEMMLYIFKENAFWFSSYMNIMARTYIL